MKKYIRKNISVEKYFKDGICRNQVYGSQVLLKVLQLGNGSRKSFLKKFKLLKKGRYKRNFCYN